MVLNGGGDGALVILGQMTEEPYLVTRALFGGPAGRQLHIEIGSESGHIETNGFAVGVTTEECNHESLVFIARRRAEDLKR